MKDPVKIGELVIDRTAINAVLRQDGRLLIFLRAGRPIVMDDTLSAEEFDKLTSKGE